MDSPCAQATALMLMMPGLVTDASTMWADPDQADDDGTWPAPAGGTRAPPPAAGRSSLPPCSGDEADGGRPCDRHRPGSASPRSRGRVARRGTLHEAELAPKTWLDVGSSAGAPP